MWACSMASRGSMFVLPRRRSDASRSGFLGFELFLYYILAFYTQHCFCYGFNFGLHYSKPSAAASRL